MSNKFPKEWKLFTISLIVSSIPRKNLVRNNIYTVCKIIFSTFSFFRRFLNITVEFCGIYDSAMHPGLD
jgi:hypothetical protein